MPPASRTGPTTFLVALAAALAAATSPASSQQASATPQASPLQVELSVHGVFAHVRPRAEVKVSESAHVALFEIEPDVGAVRLHGGYVDAETDAGTAAASFELVDHRARWLREQFRFRYQTRYRFVTRHRPRAYLLAVASRRPLRLHALDGGRYWTAVRGAYAEATAARLVEAVAGSGPGVAADLVSFGKYHAPALRTLFGGRGVCGDRYLALDRGRVPYGRGSWSVSWSVPGLVVRPLLPGGHLASPYLSPPGSHPQLAGVGVQLCPRLLFLRKIVRLQRPDDEGEDGEGAGVPVPVGTRPGHPVPTDPPVVTGTDVSSADGGGTASADEAPTREELAAGAEVRARLRRLLERISDARRDGSERLDRRVRDLVSDDLARRVELQRESARERRREYLRRLYRNPAGWGPRRAEAQRRTPRPGSARSPGLERPGHRGDPDVGRSPVRTRRTAASVPRVEGASRDDRP